MGWIFLIVLEQLAMNINSTQSIHITETSSPHVGSKRFEASMHSTNEIHRSGHGLISNLVRILSNNSIRKVHMNE